MIIFIDLKIFVKICQKMLIFWQKNHHFLYFTSRFPLVNFRRKTYQVLGKCSNWAKYWHKCTLGYLEQKMIAFLDIWCFGHFMMPGVFKMGFFWSKLSKKPLEPYNFATYMLYTVGKRKDSSITY